MKHLLLSLSILFLLVCGSPSNSDVLPTITMITPASGPIVGGTDVTIAGTNCDASTQMPTVRFGNHSATVKLATATQVVATPTTDAPGMVDVVVGNEYFEMKGTSK